MKDDSITASNKLDFFGFWASALCAIHCAVTPLFFTVSALGGLAFLADPSIEILIILSSAVLAFSSLLPSWKKHKQWEVLALSLSGFISIALGHELGHEMNSSYHEAVFAAIGGSLVALAHWRNAHILKKQPKACAVR